MNLTFIIQLCVAVASAVAAVTTCAVLIKGINKRLDRMDERIDKRFDKVDERFDKVEARLGKVELELAYLRGDMVRGFAQVHGDIKALWAERGYHDNNDDDDLGGLPTRRVRSREPAVAVQ
jgi:tetrahydromethanopterin S-methyltransferase subunit G